MSEPERRELHVGATAAGQRLDVFLAAQGFGLSRSQMKRLIDEARVALNGKPAKGSARLRAGDRVEVAIPPPVPAAAQPERIELAVLFEDRHLVVVDKPAGMVVHPAAGVASGTLVNALLAHCADLAGVGGVLRPGIVHRLDKGTTGVLVVAKSDAAHAGLARQFKAHAVERRYLALVWGRLEPARGTIDTRFGRHPTQRTRFTSRVEGGRRAVTHWEVRERFRDMTLAALRLETGRTHQIRVHLSEHGHPVVGDPVYGRRREAAGEAVRRAVRALDRQMLHAQVLGFEHPVTGERLRFETRPPADFAALLALCREDAG